MCYGTIKNRHGQVVQMIASYPKLQIFRVERANSIAFATIPP